MPSSLTVAIIGGGLIGGGWAARIILHGGTIRIFDPDPEAPRKLDALLINAERAMATLFADCAPPTGSLTFTDSVRSAVEGAEFVIESVPERIDLKQEVHREIDRHALPAAVVTSSTSGIRPSEIQQALARPERMLVAHPFNPVYLLPLVELCGGPNTAPEAIRRATDMVVALGMQPLVLRAELDGFLADRLMEALWREALWLVHDGHATAEEVDDAIRYGAGLRWAMMGTFQTFWLAGGEGGIRAMLEQFGPCLKWPWSRLTDVPELTGDLVERIAVQCEAQSRGMKPQELERIRDSGLVRILQGLEEIGWGAGQTISEHRKRLEGAAPGIDQNPERRS